MNEHATCCCIPVIASSESIVADADAYIDESLVPAVLRIQRRLSLGQAM